MFFLCKSDFTFKKAVFCAFSHLNRGGLNFWCRMVLRVLTKGEVAVKKMKMERVDLSPIDEGELGFGICVRSDSGAEMILHSICMQRGEAMRICEVVNRFGVSECHIRDVIEDLLP